MPESVAIVSFADVPSRTSSPVVPVNIVSFTVNKNVSETLAPALSVVVTLIFKVLLSVDVGEPLNTPDSALIDSHPGKALPSDNVAV